MEALDNININSLDYDNIIIDEAQDFYSKVIDYFSNVADQKNGKFYVFYDKNQLIFNKNGIEWLEKSECRLVLNKICRNTKEIAITANSSLDLKIRKYEEMTTGEMPVLNIIPKKEHLNHILNNIILKYKQQGFKNNEIVILTLTTEEKSILNNIKRIGNNNIVTTPNNKDILFTTSKKFKGLEAGAVIIIDFDNKVLETDQEKRNFYIASSRAKQKLDIIFVNENNELNLLANNIYNINMPNDIGKITFKFKVKIKNNNSIFE